ncbi:MAG: hypothetical protein SFV53_00310 [Rickettsiales bacterium]|nr:hypothetical protein [Rickettsiales bacterium]
MMIKTLSRLFLILIFSTSIIQSYAQNSETKTTDNITDANSSSNISNDQNLDSESKYIVDSPIKTAKKLVSKQKLDIATKSLSSSSLINNMEGGMVDLLLGKKTTSLMFDDKENVIIEKMVNSIKGINSNQDSDDSEKLANNFNQESYIYLASIMYSTPQDWVVWINDKKITSQSNKKTQEIFLNSVEKDQVSVLWNMSVSKAKVLIGEDQVENSDFKKNADGKIEIKFTLKTNQAFLFGSNTIVEGKSVIEMLKKKKAEESALAEAKKSEPTIMNSINSILPDKK